jgi:hypothetical protein
LLRHSDVQQFRAWVEPLARIGFVAKGVVYLLLGGLALRFAVGEGGGITDAHGAVTNLLREPYGRLLIGALAAGLGLYAAWRVLEAFADANGKGTSPAGLGARAAYAGSAAVYGALAIDAARIASASRGGAQGNTAAVPPMLFESVIGEWAIAAAAVALIVYGALQCRRAFSRQLSDRLSLSHVSASAGRAVVRLSRFGIGARAMVLAVTGVVMFRRLESLQAAADTGTAESLRLLATLPTGRVILGCVAGGLMAYGLFQFVQARYRTITPP